MTDKNKFVIYRHFDIDNILLYIGITKNIQNRLSGQKNAAHWFTKISKITLEHIDCSKEKGLDLENKYINKEKPLHNIKTNLIKERISSHQEKCRYFLSEISDDWSPFKEDGYGSAVISLSKLGLIQVSYINAAPYTLYRKFVP